MNMIRNNLLNSSVIFGLSGLTSIPEGGAGGGGGEPAPAAPAAADTSGGAPKAGDPATGFSETVEADNDGAMFAMPSDEALFTLETESEEAAASETPAKTPAGEKAATATTPASGEQPAPAAAPQPAPAAATTTPPTGTPAATPQQPAPQGQPQVEQPAAPQAPQPSILELLDQNRPALVAQLAKDVYAISDADAEAIGLVDKGPLERMAANLHVNVMRAQTAMLMQTLPSTVATIVERLGKVEEATAAFYAANPELDRKADHAVVEKYAQMFWQAHPKGTIEQFNKQVGMMAKAELNKLVATAAPTPAPGVQPKPVPRKQTPTFTPATPQGGAPASAKAAPVGDEVWGVLAEHLLNPDE